jgi:hypothetical protein
MGSKLITSIYCLPGLRVLKAFKMLNLQLITYYPPNKGSMSDFNSITWELLLETTSCCVNRWPTAISPKFIVCLIKSSNTGQLQDFCSRILCWIPSKSFERCSSCRILCCKGLASCRFGCITGCFPHGIRRIYLPISVIYLTIIYSSFDLKFFSKSKIRSYSSFILFYSSSY